MPDPAVNGNHASSPQPQQRDHGIHELETPNGYIADRLLKDQDDTVEIKIDEPPLKKRKLTDGGGDGSHRSSRTSSPPWRNFSADGPTSFLENGRRKSGRTNLIPLEKQARAGRRQTRAAYDKILDKHARSPYQTSPKVKREEKLPPSSTKQETVKRGPGRPPKVKVEQQVAATPKLLNGRSPRKTATKTTRRTSSVPRTNGYGQASSDSDQSPPLSSPNRPLTLQKVKFRVALPKPAVTTPANIPLPKKYANFEDFLDQDDQEPYPGQDLLNVEQIQKEALARYRVHEAQSDGRLAKQRGAVSVIPERSNEPRRQYAHFDHLLGHVVHFRALLRQEHKEHRRRAEQIAYEAKRYVEDKQKKGHIKTAEELAQEQIEKCRNIYRSVIKDLDKLWASVEIEINQIRLRNYEEEQQAKIKGHLNRVLERTDQMLQRQDESDMVTELLSETASSSTGASDSEDVSDSQSESDTDMVPEDPDAGLTTEELRAKYENLPALVDEEIDAEADNDISDHTSDEDTEMDSEFDEDESSVAGSEDEIASDEESGGGLMSLFFSKKQIAEMDTQVPKEDSAEAEVEAEAEAEAELSKDDSLQETTLNGQVASPLIEEMADPMDIDQAYHSENAGDPVDKGQDAGTTNGSNEILARDAEDEATIAESIARDEVSPSQSVLDENASSAATAKAAEVRTPVPSLLRGTLRQYQHEGLDWLANLYANGRSGILADEMGLGKTIQSISLLAHLATEYEIWGPHLIVVPTSVMLNWEMEFKKFLPGFKILTYYGNLEERKQKRRGWMADDSFNVCITSYQLVLQDANSFKRRRWHYMILDEAHNIKNFRSERWQTMMTFNTRARLLLTGTPLQNNLTELWSLLFFLHYGQEGQDDDDAFAGLKEWSEWFKRPVESILEHGRQILDAEDKEQVVKLHKVIRPYLLRRLKADVEKQMPLKYEHVEICRLSKRQRQLYDGFMSRAQTKETLASGNYLSIINALMQLRKVCNHPDLFETRPINTSFAMTKSVAAEFEIRDLLIRRKLFTSHPLEEIDLDFLQLVPISNERISLIENLQTLRRHAYAPIKALRDSQWSRVNRKAVATYHEQSGLLTTLDNMGRRARLQDLDRTVYYEAYRHHQRPIYGRGLLQKLNLNTTYEQLSRLSSHRHMSKRWGSDSPLATLRLVQSVGDRASGMSPIIQHYACVTPAVVAMNLGSAMVSEAPAATMRQELIARSDPFHAARMKLSIAFPDKRLLQYDCGKLQRLDKLLRRLQAGGHRALIFTQMTKVLDILEQFLNIHGHRYLRLDGATKIEQRQILTDRFNNDTRILAFILSSRSGGLGINLTGADTVIFYDLDWNPAMDKQCTDRAHRIGQTRDVHIYRFVSEHTIESNILRKANQKQLLDDVVIQEGDFTTDYKNRVSYKDMLDDSTAADDVAGAAMNRVLGNDKSAVAAFEHAEDKEDVSAAKVAVKEVQHADDGDFEDKAAGTPNIGEAVDPGPFGATDAAITDVAEDGIHHIDEYLLKMQTFLLKDVPFIKPRDKAKRGRRKDEHRKRRAR